jgi:ABC-type multidrug transport system ATPase subunit
MCNFIHVSVTFFMHEYLHMCVLSYAQGASGSGKTCLLNALSCRLSCVSALEPLLKGSIMLDNKLVSYKDFRRQSVLIPQEDTLFPYLTVEETFQLAAIFHSSTKDLQSARDVAKSKIEELNLAKISKSIIGSISRRGISGGEKKRVAIGKELFGNPIALFVDEPTSGLDSFQASSVISLLSEMASAGRLVLTVLHQPRSSIFAMLDRLMVLSEGRVIYFGAVSTCLHYFAQIGT